MDLNGLSSGGAFLCPHHPNHRITTCKLVLYGNLNIGINVYVFSGASLTGGDYTNSGVG
jgi:hypothetical protein